MKSDTPPSRTGRLYLVGVGPGDPELMTYKAARILSETKVWAVPTARKGGTSSARQIAEQVVPTNGRIVLSLCFPMKKVYLGQETDDQLLAAWRRSADEVIRHLDLGEDVAFPTLGDATLYSTAFYLLAMIQEERPQTPVTVVPGITAMAACAASQSSPLALGDDVLAVVPAAFEDERLRAILTTLDAVVLMKVHRRIDALIDLLEELDLVGCAVLTERSGMEGERVYTDVREARGRQLHYFSTMVIRKKKVQVSNGIDAHAA
ncbi:precorrin-2 C(20)-methyltransferase [Desulfobulbus elongatus]|uniref:precorrin-2 C(20)-methyltransferase n=1 Tax=Desulfobulbus elongatus TaxID=53332 RepID=UPI0006872BA1|nr:precorrin-2 C(20)-methyltransferase [Desulfobulbus elongatus]